MQALGRLAARRPVAVSVIAAALVVLGWTSWSDLPLDLLPDLETPTIVVSVRSGDRPPAEMERLYGEQIEQRLFSVSGIREISQVARTGRLIATVVFDWNADMDFSQVEVEKAVGPIRSDPDVDEVLVRHFDPRQRPVLSVGLVAAEDGPDLAELRRLARRQVAIALERLEGVAEARVSGGREREIQVLVDRYRMESYGLTLGGIAERLRAVNLDVDAGTLEEGGRVLLVRGLSRFRDPEDVARAVLRFAGRDAERGVAVRVADVATVTEVDREVTHLVRVDGREGVAVAIYKEAGANTVAVSRTVREALSTFESDLPQVGVHVITDESTLVETAIADVQQSLLVGIVLAVLVLILFLRSLAPTIVVAASIPVSLLATLFFMHLAGHTLNLMTLGGLALGSGMLVDNSIVMVEAIFRRLSAGDAASAGADAVGEVAGGIAASTLTACAVFAPIVFVQGLAARLVTGLAFTVVVSLTVSFVVAVFLIPAFSTWFLAGVRGRGTDPGTSTMERNVLRLLERPFSLVLILLPLTVLAVWGLVGLGTELLPPADPREFSVRLVGPSGQRVEATERVVEAAEQILRAAAGGDVEAMLSEVGRLPEDDRLIREEQTEENTARITVRLAGRTSSSTVVEAAAPAFAALGNVEASWEVGTSVLSRALGTSGPPVVVELMGQSLEDLRTAASEVRNRLVTVDALWNVRSSFEGGPPELRVVLDRTLADGLGVDLDTVAATLEAALDGRPATVMTLGDEEREVVLRLPRARADELLTLPLATASGTRVSVGDIATLVPTEGAREIFRRDQRRVARLTARIAPDHDYPAAMAAARAELEQADLPPGLQWRLGGEEEQRERTFEELALAGALALLLVFMVLAGTFESLLQPLTIMASVPIALVGVAAVLVPLGRPIGVMEALGMIVLAGIAVNDAIHLVATASHMMDSGIAPKLALARAAAIRLRPNIMTSAATILALLPLALGTSEAARLRSPLALTVIGGMITCTAGSLYVIPCLYLLLERMRPSRRRVRATQAVASPLGAEG